MWFKKKSTKYDDIQDIIKQAFIKTKIANDLEQLTEFVVNVFKYILTNKNQKEAQEVVFQVSNMFLRVGTSKSVGTDIAMVTNFANCFYTGSTVQEIGDLMFSMTIAGMKHQGFIK